MNNSISCGNRVGLATAGAVATAAMVTVVVAAVAVVATAVAAVTIVAATVAAEAVAVVVTVSVAAATVVTVAAGTVAAVTTEAAVDTYCTCVCQALFQMADSSSLHKHLVRQVLFCPRFTDEEIK